MRRAIATLAIAVGVGVLTAPRGEPVHLRIDQAVGGGGGCVLLHRVVDVVARPADGTPIDKSTGAEFTWPRGFSAQRAGAEVQVVRDGWQVVLTTGRRYWMCPDPFAFFRPTGVGAWVIGDVRECPACRLGTEAD